MVTVVIITRNRAFGLRETLSRLTALPEHPPVVVVDNGSSDDTPRVVADAGPLVRGIALGRNIGSAGRNIGVSEAKTPYVAFSDDDSWWAPGALERATRRFAHHPGLGLIAAAIRVGKAHRLDPICTVMARSPLAGSPDLPGPSILGFIACGAVVRRDAFLQVGGFHPRFGVGGEERLFAIDLARAGWQLAYCDDVEAHHHPAAGGARPGRRAVMVRNDLWTTWLRAPPFDAFRATARALFAGLRDGETRQGLRTALLGLPWVMRERTCVGDELGRNLRYVSGGH